MRAKAVFHVEAELLFDRLREHWKALARDAARTGPGTADFSRTGEAPAGDGKPVVRESRTSLVVRRGRRVRIPGLPGIRTS